MPAHLGCQHIWAGHFPKGKNREAVFTAGTPTSWQANAATRLLPRPAWIQLAEVGACCAKHAASRGSGCGWWMALLHPESSASRISTRTAHPQQPIHQYFFYFPVIPALSGSNLHCTSHCGPQHLHLHKGCVKQVCWSTGGEHPQ